MPSRRSEAGFTIVEMLVVTLIGGVLLMALMSMVDASQSASNRIVQRVDSSQRGRVAMEQITQALRSQVCIKDDPASLSPIAYGDARTLGFYAAVPRKVAGQVNPTAFAPERRELRFETDGRIIEEVRVGTGVYPDMLFPTVTRRRAILTHAAPRTAGEAIFTYWALKPDGTVSGLPLPVPLSADDRESVVRVDIAFVAKPTSGNRTSGTQTAFESSVSVRLPTRTDSDHPGSGPACML